VARLVCEYQTADKEGNTAMWLYLPPKPNGVTLQARRLHGFKSRQGRHPGSFFFAPLGNR